MKGFFPGWQKIQLVRKVSANQNPVKTAAVGVSGTFFSGENIKIRGRKKKFSSLLKTSIRAVCFDVPIWSENSGLSWHLMLINSDSLQFGALFFLWLNNSKNSIVAWKNTTTSCAYAIQDPLYISPLLRSKVTMKPRQPTLCVVKLRSCRNNAYSRQSEYSRLSLLWWMHWLGAPTVESKYSSAGLGNLNRESIQN